MILGFKQKFVEPILNGSKIHSFRHDPNQRWKPEMAIQMATGVRTKNYNCFKEATCISVQECKLVNRPASCILVIDQCVFHWNVMEVIARNDGFENPYDFINFFLGDSNRNYTDVPLRLIHWTEFTYDYSLES